MTESQTGQADQAREPLSPDAERELRIFYGQVVEQRINSVSGGMRREIADMVSGLNYFNKRGQVGTADANVSMRNRVVDGFMTRNAGVNELVHQWVDFADRRFELQAGGTIHINQYVSDPESEDAIKLVNYSRIVRRDLGGWTLNELEALTTVDDQDELEEAQRLQRIQTLYREIEADEGYRNIGQRPDMAGARVVALRQDEINQQLAIIEATRTPSQQEQDLTTQITDIEADIQTRHLDHERLQVQPLENNIVMALAERAALQSAVPAPADILTLNNDFAAIDTNIRARLTTLQGQVGALGLNPAPAQITAVQAEAAAIRNIANVDMPAYETTIQNTPNVSPAAVTALRNAINNTGQVAINTVDTLETTLTGATIPLEQTVSAMLQTNFQAGRNETLKQIGGFATPLAQLQNVSNQAGVDAINARISQAETEIANRRNQFNTSIRAPREEQQNQLRTRISELEDPGHYSMAAADVLARQNAETAIQALEDQINDELSQTIGQTKIGNLVVDNIILERMDAENRDVDAIASNNARIGEFEAKKSELRGKIREIREIYQELGGGGANFTMPMNETDNFVIGNLQTAMAANVTLSGTTATVGQWVSGDLGRRLNHMVQTTNRYGVNGQPRSSEALRMLLDQHYSGSIEDHDVRANVVNHVASLSDNPVPLRQTAFRRFNRWAWEDDIAAPTAAAAGAAAGGAVGGVKKAAGITAGIFRWGVNFIDDIAKS